MTRQSRPERWFRRLLRLFPAEFRGDFGDEMTRDFGDAHADAADARDVRAARRRLWCRTTGDVLRRAPVEHLEILRRDAGYALRMLRRRRVLAVSAILTLAVGIGLNAAVFSVVDHVLLTPLPFAGSERLVRLFEIAPLPNRDEDNVSSANFLDWQSRSRTLDAMALVTDSPLTLSGVDEPEQIDCASVSRSFFAIVSVRPELGRLFDDNDFRVADAAAGKALTSHVQTFASLATVVSISHELWQRQFHGDPHVIGRTVNVDGAPVPIIGVMPADFPIRDFRSGERTDCWLPMALDPIQRRARFYMAIGRLRPGASLARAQSEFDGIASNLAAAYPDADKGYGVRLVPFVAALTSSVRARIWFLFGATVSVLLIAGANVAGLLLAGASGRRQELLTRVALGASRARLARQAATEGLIVGGFGGAVGLILAAFATPALVRWAPPEIPRLDEIRLSGAVLAAGAIAAIAIGVACGFVVAWQARRIGRGEAAPASSARVVGAGKRARRVLAVMEIAIALTLVIAATLLTETVRHLEAQPLGIDPTHVISIRIPLNIAKYERRTFVASADDDQVALANRLRQLPDVIAAGVGSEPLGSGGIGDVFRDPRAAGEERRMAVDALSPGFIEALGVRLIAGRFFTDDDNRTTQPVAIVNESGAAVLSE